MFAEFSKITNGYPQSEIYELGFKKKIISYERQKSKNIKSNQNILKLFTNFFEMIIGTSGILFKYIFIIGVFIFLFSVVNFLYMLFEYLNSSRNNSNGLYALLTYISFFGSLNLLFLGIIGNYLLKIIREGNKKNKYYVDEIINNK